MNIMIVDDHAVVRRGLQQVLAEEFPKAQFGEAESASSALGLLGQRHWNLLILDVTMPGRSGLDMLRDVHHQQPQLPVLLLSVHPEEQYAIRAIKAGAAGYLTKDRAPEELVGAVRKVLAGQHYVSDRLAEQLVSALGAHRQRPRHERLSDREFEVLRLLAAGQSAKEIAGTLSLSVKTVSTYRVRGLAKMGMQSAAEFTRYAVDRNLIE